MSKTGRNEPCPCGRGRKYKACHGAAAANEPAETPKDASRAVERSLMWLRERHRKGFVTASEELLYSIWPEADADVDEPPLRPEIWSSVQAQVAERMLADGELLVRGDRVKASALLLGPGGPAFSDAERLWLQAMVRAPLRLYSVTDVRAGEGLTLVDVLDPAAAPLRVQERSGSRDAQLGMLMGARVVLLPELAQLSGVVYAFSGAWRDEAMARVQAAEAWGGADAEDRAAFRANSIMTAWLLQHLRPAPMPVLVDSSTGEPLLFITDHYTLLDPAALVAALQAAPDMHAAEDGVWSRLERGANGADRPLLTVTLKADSGRVQVFYRTQQRADQGRPWFEGRAGAAVQHLTREVSDLRGSARDHAPAHDQLGAPLAQGAAGAAKKLDVPPETMHVMMKETLHRYYARWSDEPIPMLGGLTPRLAIRTAAGEERVRGLLRLYEDGEARMAREQRRLEVSYDFLWQQIGLQRQETR